MPLEEIDLIHLKNAKKILLDLKKDSAKTKIKQKKIHFTNAGKPLLEELKLPSLKELKK